MSKTVPFAALLLLLASGGSSAEVLELPTPTAESSLALPAKGSSKSSVLQRFGEPKVRHATVGGGQPKQPPITRWDYAQFSVFFEYDHVVDAVLPGAPPPIHRREELSAVQ